MAGLRLPSFLIEIVCSFLPLYPVGVGKDFEAPQGTKSHTDCIA